VLEHLAKQLGEDVAESTRRVEVVVVGSGMDVALLRQICAIGKERGLDLVIHAEAPAQPLDDRVLLVSDLAERSAVRRDLIDILGGIRLEDDFPLPVFDVEAYDVPTEQKPLKHHSMPKLNQFMNNQRSKGPPVRKQFALKRPPRRGNR